MSQTTVKKFKELEVKNVQASSTHKDDIAKHAIDGKSDTKFSAKGRDEFLVLDLGEPQKVSRLSVKWFESDLRKMTYELSCSVDGKTFRRIGACVSSGVADNEYEDHDFERPIEARYFRITGQENTLNSFMSIVDVKVFTDKTDDGPTAPLTASEISENPNPDTVTDETEEVKLKKGKK